MRILILGAGKMGAFFTDLLSFNHDVAVYDSTPERLRFTFNCRRFISLDEVDSFNPQIVLNAVTVKHTISAFEQVLPHVDKTTILADIASVKTGLPDFYQSVGNPFVSTHPMFGPTFASLSNLTNENAIIISESDCLGKAFFKDLYAGLGLHIEEYSFEDHDKTMAYCLSIPFASTLVFASIMKKQDAPGTTFKRHLAIAQGLLNEDDYLLAEILFNPNTPAQLDKITERLTELKKIVEGRDMSAVKNYLSSIRNNIVG